MTDTLVAAVNRTHLHSLEVPDAFETDGSFDVELRNDGESTHVHLHLDDSLSAVARLEATNHYVRSESTRRVHVAVDAPDDTQVRGRMKVVTAYGAETRYVTITVDTTGHTEVQVDPDLGQPQPTDEGLLARVDPTLFAVVVPGVVALALAAGALVSAGAVAIVFGVLAVLSGMVAAGLAALR
ncbi:DUF7524 family protein [Halorarius halobius]|uniref:DUF7524 family protein n=1 Tax=Halorarius halobius TaxID=2962671 RepID=UPI0020CC6394|nr:hypothetical protein [Halorarius halobius]